MKPRPKTSHLRISAPAKVNLYLHVTGKRPDGYHLLESLVAFTDVCDTVEVATADTLSLTLKGPYAVGLQAEEENIVLKAARKLATWAGIEPHVHITLHKEIPLGAGLGGGSADAAAVLKLLTQLWQLNISQDTFMAIALELGADVPVMLTGKAAFVSGIGEHVEPVIQPFRLPAVLVNPGVFLSTPAVFKQGVARFSPPMPTPEPIAQVLAQRHNDLETAAITLQPVLREVLEILAMQPGCVFSRMSGSGATCFAVFDNEAQAGDAAKAIATTRKNWWVKETGIY